MKSNSTLRETLKEVVVKFGNNIAEDYSGNTDFTNEERLDLDETLTQLEALIQRKQLEARESELEMFKKVPVTDMGKLVAQHISRRYAELEDLKETE